MTTPPTPLPEPATYLCDGWTSKPYHTADQLRQYGEAEYKRGQSEVNQELLEALQITKRHLVVDSEPHQLAEAVIAKATGEKP